MFKLGVIVSSTRPGRLGLPIAKWFVDIAERHKKFDIEFIDLLEQNLPMLDEPKHPRLQQYEKEHTKAWSAKIKSCDAFIFVVPEYNYSAPPALINAVDYLYVEWGYKAAGIVSYGGISGGTRSAQMVRLLLNAVKLVALADGVSIPFAVQLKNADGSFKGSEAAEKSANALLDELHKWTGALQTLRA